MIGIFFPGLLGGLFLMLLVFFLVIIAVAIIVVVILVSSKTGRVHRLCNDVDNELMKLNPVHPSLERFREAASGVLKSARSRREPGRARMLQAILPDALRAVDAFRRALEAEKNGKEGAADKVASHAESFDKIAENLEQWAGAGTGGVTDEDAAEIIRQLSSEV